ncbi:hypothetical protein KVT40_002124 [Elsinoe batatas]|uniref:Uncharacterized protein n=1 Tax=Elsinoe batatas TaxID=2601811 RepID=A0A8K0LAH3_9PEZI|nr:hypothetical protein KVT40_002124 [Elsinoe batatas]
MVGSQKLKALQGLAWFGDHPDRWLTYDDFRPLTRRRKESAKSIWMNIHPWATKPRVKFSRPSKANRAKNRAIAGNDQDSDLISSGDDDPISVDDDDLISVRDNDLISIEDDPPISIRHDHLITEPPTLAMDAPEARADEERQLDARRHRTSVYPAPLPAFPGQAISRGEIRSVPTGSANTSNVDAVSSRTRSSRRRPIPNPHDDNGSCILGCSHVGAGDYTVPTLHPAVGTTLVPSNASSEQPHEVQVFGPVSGYISGFTQPRSSQPVPSGNVLDAAQAQPLPAVTCAVSQPSTTTTGVLPALAEGIGSTPKEGRFKQRIIVNLPKPVRPAANHVEEMIPAVKDPLRHVSLFVGARCGDSARLSSLTALSSGVDSVNDAADTQVRQFHQAMKRKRRWIPLPMSCANEVLRTCRR